MKKNNDDVEKDESALRIARGSDSYVFSPPGPTSILPFSFHAPGFGAAQPVTDFAPDLEEHQPRTSIACTLPSRSAVAACTQRAQHFRAAAESAALVQSAQPNDTLQTQGSLTPSQLVLVVLPCSAGSCLTEYRTISSAAAAES